LKALPRFSTFIHLNEGDSSEEKNPFFAEKGLEFLNKGKE